MTRYITSDCDAVSIIHDNQGYAKTPEDAVADVLKAGTLMRKLETGIYVEPAVAHGFTIPCVLNAFVLFSGMDVNCGKYLLNYTKSAVGAKKLAENDVDRALQNLFSLRMRLGLFNGKPGNQLYGNIGPDQVCTKEHQDLALEAALDGIVLLKNSNRLLPFSKWKTSSLAVIGPNAEASKTLLGNYYGPPCKTVTPLQGLQSYVRNVKYHPGCNFVNCTSASFNDAVNFAKNVDQVVLVMGLDQTQEREDFDRVDLVLPGKQKELITEVARAAKKPVVLVLLTGGPVDVTFAKYNPKIGSILWAGYPGESGGTALAQIIFGDHNPGGRLPITWYSQDFIRVPMTDMRMRSEPSSGYPGRTYRFYKGRTVFNFGYGLSYCKYSYEFASITKHELDFKSTSNLKEESSSSPKKYRLVSELDVETCEKNKANITIRVQNEGELAGKHPVLLFVKQTNPGADKPITQLIGFQPVSLESHGKAEIGFEFRPCEHLARADEHGVMLIEEGSHVFVVGDKEYPIKIAL